MRNILLLMTMLSCLTACTTPEQRAQKEQAEMELRIVEHGPACTQVGFTPNTDPWRNCVLQQAANAEAKKGGLSTSIFGSFGRWGRGSGGGVGLGVGVGR